MENSEKMKIEIWSDVMCPFCYIGKKRLEQVIENAEYKDQIEIIWKSFQLDPKAVTDPSVKIVEHLSKKYAWSLEDARERVNATINMAKDEGLDFQYDNAIYTNSHQAHRLLQFAKTQRKGNELKERLFKAYFTEGKNVDDTTILLAIAKEIELDIEESKKVLENKNSFADKVAQDAYEAQNLDVRGVPFFLFDRKYAIRGAQVPKTFEGALDQAFGEWKKNQNNDVNTIASGDSCDANSGCC
ncbi:MAG: DsbA family oxidoreductase [Cytophagales bacterium]|nr:DsbA family oxidoreductase [Cytophagales bacterium]